MCCLLCNNINILTRTPHHFRSHQISAMFSRRLMSSLARLDPVQEALLTEPCILVSPEDKVVGSASKRECHRVQDGSSLLHRAFSLFVFNSRSELLLQQRSHTKITFPGLWTNTCCSHPLATTQEMEETDQLGVRAAAQRRLELELGVPQSEAPVKDIKFITRILYKAPSNNSWAEHELDYILFLQAQDGLTLAPSKDEVRDTEWVGRHHLGEFLRDLESREVGITPWFKLCAEVTSNSSYSLKLNPNNCYFQKLLPVWWENLDQLEKIRDTETIHRFY